jgi:NADPH:quinone reductase-like Zn-dependent oxidoreductase
VHVSGGGSGDPNADYALGVAAELAAAGKFSLPVAQTFSLADAPAAHRESEAGHVRGKLVLVP